jgi:plasmid stabilization system protein ParE
MTPRFLFRLAARAELFEARYWYESQRAGLGEEFAAAVSGAIDRIGAHPELYPVIRLGVRRAVLLEFPYALFYRLQPGVVEILAVFHHSRDPRVWQSRAEP